MFQTRYVNDNGEVISDYKRRIQSENDIYFNSGQNHSFDIPMSHSSVSKNIQGCNYGDMSF
jgi:hypothetical protein